MTGGLTVFAKTGSEAAQAVAEAMEETTETIESMRDKMDSLIDRMASDFVNRMTKAAQGGKNAFEGFFTYMKNRLIELALQFAIFKTLGGMFPESDFLRALAAGFNMESALPSGNLNVPDLSAGIKATKLRTRGHILASNPAGSSAGMTVNQNINFTVSAIDARDAARFIQEQKGTIAGVMAEATQNSRAYRNQLLGAV